MNTFTQIDMLAQAAPATGGGGGGFQMVIMMALVLVVMWVVMIRPQQKRQKQLQKKIDSLQKGDKIVTIGGLHGVINHINTEKGTLSLRVADGQFITFDKKAVATVLTEEKAEEEK